MSATLDTIARQHARVFVEGAAIQSILGVLDEAQGLVIFAHATGRSRNNPNNQQLAQILNDAGFATLMCDLLTEEEQVLDDITGEFRFDAALMSKRLIAITHWCVVHPSMQGLPVAYFGAGTGAAAALIAAAARQDLVRAIVVRGGRLDLAWSDLPNVRAPTLIVVGEHDRPMRASYSMSIERLACAEKELAVISGAGHLFLEPGTRKALGRHAAHWFSDHVDRNANAPQPPRGSSSATVLLS